VQDLAGRPETAPRAADDVLGEDVLVVDSVTMRYPGRRGRQPTLAVDGVSLRVRQGEIVALLGRNGAGKSSLIRMICTLTLPTEGRIRVAGHDVVTKDSDARRSLGVVLGGERSVYWKLTGRQNLAFFAALRGLRGRAAEAVIARALQRVDLADRADDYVEAYSTGMRQRLVIARALIGDPAVIVMDEPTAGLDPHATASLQKLIVGLRDAGHGILITTHQIEEAEAIADRVAVIDGGRLVACDTPRALRDSLGATDTLTCVLQAPSGRAVEDLVAGFDVPLTVLAVVEVEDGLPDRRIEVTLGGQLTDSTVARFMRHAVDSDWTVHSLRAEPLTLRHTFLTLTGREISDQNRGPDDEPE
jgi:ABC-2 type transport system ATP-binding protein